MPLNHLARVRRAPIVVRLVASVLAAMSAVWLVGAGLVFWQVDRTLNNHLTQSLTAYRAVGLKAIEDGDPIPQIGRFRYQIIDGAGPVLKGGPVPELVPQSSMVRVLGGTDVSGATGSLFTTPSYLWTATRATYLGQKVVVVFAINRNEQNQALQSLLAQLLLLGLGMLAVAAWVGRRTARAVLDPVERYRRAAADANPNTRLPVSTRDDELSRLGNTFNDLLDRIGTAQERERRFLADASHELRAPLSIMRAEVEVAAHRAENGDTSQRDMVQSLLSQIGRLERLCNALLQWEELRGATRVKLECLRVADVLEEVAASARRLPVLGDRSVVVVAPADLQLPLHHHWIGVALGNLVSNAVRYGSGTITLGCTTRSEHTGQAIELWVTDEGPGIPVDFLPRAFDRFALSDRSRATGGTGLGLPIVAEIAQLHNATVAVDEARVALVFTIGACPGSGDADPATPAAGRVPECEHEPSD